MWTATWRIFDRNSDEVTRGRISGKAFALKALLSAEDMVEHALGPYLREHGAGEISISITLTPKEWGE